MASRTDSASPSQPIDWRSPGDIKRVGKELYAEFGKDNVTSLAAAFAYHTVFAIPALLILTVTIAALVNVTTNVDVTGNLKELIAERAPGDTRVLLNSIVDNAIAKTSGGGATFGVAASALLALWSGSNAVAALIDAFNRAYGVKESRKWVRKKGLTIGLTLVLALFINLAFALLVFGERIGSWIADRAGLGSVFDVAWNLARWPAAVAAVGILLSVLYYAGPNVEQSFRWVSAGSVLSTILWLVATAGFGIYLRFSDPGSAYPFVGNILVLLFFLYVTGIVFLLGAELNALVAKRYDPATIDDLADNPDADLETRLSAEAKSAGRSTEPDRTGSTDERTDSQPTAHRDAALPSQPTSRPSAGLVVTAGALAATGGLRVVARALRRRRAR